MIYEISSTFEGFYFGSLSIILLINLIFFLKLRDKSYLLFAFYILFLIISEISVLEKNSSLKLFSCLLSYAFFIFLIRKLLNLKQEIASVYNPMLYFGYFFILISLPSLFSPTYSEFICELQTYISSLFLITTTSVILLGLGKKLQFSKHLFLAVFLIIIENIFIFIDNENSYYYRIGTFLSGLVLAFSLLLHFVNKLKDTQLQVIFNLEEMNILKEEANLKLDEKVKQRTHALQAANDLLSTQKEEIENIVQTLEDANEQIMEQKELIEETHSKITESINSASYIQMAMLPQTDIFEQYFNNFFIFYKPRDIVSGDFYWIKKIENKLIISAADCTGHGVPGAMVSMLGISLLTEIVRKKEIKTASVILDELRTALKRSLQQKGSENEAKEGIDMILCIIDIETKTMQYAGANSSIYIIRDKNINELEENSKIKIHTQQKDKNSNNILVEIKGNHQPIGAYRREKEFTNHEIQLFSKDSLYLFSDGFVDQFGGEKGYKFRTRPFKNFLLDIQNFGMKKQKELISESFYNWKGSYRQLDDVLVMGLKL